MQTFNKFFLALAFLGGSAAAQAADTNELARAPTNKTSERFEAIERRHWGQSLSQQGTYNGLPVAQKNLAGHYDLRQPVPVVLSAGAGSSQEWKPTQQRLHMISL